MPRLKVTDDELDIDDLESAEYSDQDYDTYDGELPPPDTHLKGYLKKCWWTYTGNEDPMIKVLFVADGNTGNTEEFNGLPIWENLPLIRTAKFRWKPWMDAMGITLLDVKKKITISDETENNGDPIEKIGALVIGEDALCSVVTKSVRYKGEPKTEVRRWLPYDEDDADEENEEELEDEEPEDEEPEEEEEPPTTRRRRPAATAAKKPAAKTPAKPAGRTPARPAAKGTGRRAQSSRRLAGYDEEPPF